MARHVNFEKLVVPGVRGLQPYVPGKPIEEVEREYGISDSIKLASNENPLGPSPQVLAAIRGDLDTLGLYPDGGGHYLKQALAAHHRTRADAITLGNGSNDILVLLAEAFLGPGISAVYDQYSFVVYRLAVQAAGAQARVAPSLSAQHAQPLGHDLATMRGLVDADTRIVFIANPNNPTGTWCREEELRALVSGVPPETIVVIDEAYAEYVSHQGYPNAAAWIEEFPNIVVTRTFSKIYGLAGLRIGYSISHPAVAEILNRVRQPFNVNSLAQTAAMAALQDAAHVEESRHVNAQGIEYLSAGLAELGFGVLPSIGNFLLVDMGQSAAPVCEALMRVGIIVRPVANYGLPDHLRISIGLPAQNRRLLDALRSIAATK